MDPRATLNDARQPVYLCPKCDRELGTVSLPESMSFGPTPTPANVPLLPGANMVPVVTASPPAAVTPPPFQVVAPPIPPGSTDYVSTLRNRLAWLEGQVLIAAAYKQEIELLKKMLAPVRRQRRAKVVTLKVAK